MSDSEKIIKYHQGIYLDGILSGERIPEECLYGIDCWRVPAPTDDSKYIIIEYKSLVIVNKQNALPWLYLYCGDRDKAEAAAISRHN